MSLFFFDVVSAKFRCFDYRGSSFSGSEDAAYRAELLAADLGFSETTDWIGSQVQVWTAAGDMLCSIPVVDAA